LFPPLKGLKEPLTMSSLPWNALATPKHHVILARTGCLYMKVRSIYHHMGLKGSVPTPPLSVILRNMHSTWNIPCWTSLVSWVAWSWIRTQHTQLAYLALLSELNGLHDHPWTPPYSGGRRGDTNTTTSVHTSLRPYQLNFLFLIPSLIKIVNFIKNKSTIMFLCALKY